MEGNEILKRVLQEASLQFAPFQKRTKMVTKQLGRVVDEVDAIWSELDELGLASEQNVEDLLRALQELKSAGSRIFHFGDSHGR